MNTTFSKDTLLIPEGFTLVLGSISRCRRQILDTIHVDCIKTKAGIDESKIRDDDPRILTTKLAEAKLDKILQRQTNEKTIYITGDQVALKNGVIREKPKSDKQCYEYLDSYVNSDVHFCSSVCVYNSETKKRFIDCDISCIEFNDIPKEVQNHLVQIGDVKYSCGGITVENVEFQNCIKHMDCYDCIMGLPLYLIQKGIDYVSNSFVFYN